ILDNGDIFGHGVANIGDIDGDGVDDLAIGAQHDDDEASNSGAVYILFMNTDGTVKSDQKISNTQGGFANLLAENDNFGNSITGLGDLNNDGIPDIAIGTAFKDDGGPNRGVVWIMFLNSNGTVKSFQRISDTQGNFTGVLNDNDRFGISVACIGDLDGDGIADIAVGASLDDDGGTDRGAVWILHLNSNGTVKFHEKISSQFGNFAGALANGDRFSEVATLGDLDGDGIVDIAVGATLDDDGGSGTGAVWILFLNSDGSVKGHQKISATSGGFTGLLDAGDRFAFPSNIGDLDGDQITDIAVGTFFDDDGGTNRGAVWILFMNSDGTVKAHQKISSTVGNFTGTISNGDLFGLPVAGIGDLNGDGTPDLLVGARQNDDGGTDRGAAWVLFLDESNSPVLIDGIDIILTAQDTSSRIFDRFGNVYTEEDLQVINTHLPQLNNNGHCTTGIFNLGFFGAEFGNDPNNQNMMNVICQVFNDVSTMIAPSLCNGNTPLVNMLISSDTVGNAALPPGALAGASSFYTPCGPTDNTGIIEGDVWKAINTGFNVPGVLDGFILVNFNLAPLCGACGGCGVNCGWNYDPANATGGCQWDLYSVILHEVLHTMGFNSFIGPNGNSTSNVSSHYTRFDTYIETVAGNDFITWDGCYMANFGPAAVPCDIVSGCGNVQFNAPSSGLNPIHAPEGNLPCNLGDYRPGSSMSHFEVNCGGLNNYVMNPGLACATDRRVPTAAEILTLCDLGYETTGNFGDANGPFGALPFHGGVVSCTPPGGTVVAGNNDGTGAGTGCNTNTITFEACLNQVDQIFPLINDIGVGQGNTGTFECLQVVTPGPWIVSGSNGPQTGTFINFDAQGATGLVNLTYVPVGANGFRGNITCVQVLIVPCGNTTCATVADCNQLCNGDFTNLTCGVTSGAPACDGSPFGQNWVSNWMRSHGTPQISGTNGNPYARMWSATSTCANGTAFRGEGIITADINVEAGQTYFFSYFRRNTDAVDANDCISPATDVLDNIRVFLTNVNVNVGGTFIPGVPGVSQQILHETNIQVGGGFQQVVICFEADADYGFLWLYPQQNVMGDATWVEFDDIELIEDDFDAGSDQIVNTCGQTILGDPNLCEVTGITYQWASGGPGVIISPPPHNSTQITTDQNQTTIYTLTRTLPAFPNNSVIVIGSQNGCPLVDDVTVTVINPISLILNPTDVACHGDNNGAINLIVNGGAAPFDFLWSNNETTQDISGLTGGSYSVTVTDANGCTVVTNATITEPAPLLLTASTSAPTFCGASDASIDLTVTGGTPGFAYAWSNGFTTEDLSGLTAGIYTVTVTDNNGCMRTLTKILNDAPGPIIIAFKHKPTTCFGVCDGGAKVTVSGGLPPYAYEWRDSQGMVVSQNQIANNLCAGVHTLKVIDANGCFTFFQITITEPDPIILNLVSTDINCVAGTGGSAVVAPTGGTEPYIYLWDDPALQTNAAAVGLAAGSYSILVTDDNGCQEVGTVIINTQGTLQPILSSLNVACNGDNSGSASVLTVNGGAPPYAYEWGLGQTTVAITNLTAGIYTVTVYDAFSCQGTSSVTLIEPAQPLLISTTATDASACLVNDGTATAIPTGGTASYMYSWDDPGLQNTAQAVGLAAGVYTVTVTDNNGCISIETVIVSGPGGLSVSTTSTAVRCNGESNGLATAIGNGGVLPYAYQWNNGQTTSTAINLTPNTYFVTLTDNVGCTAFGSITVTEPSPLVLTTSHIDWVVCADQNQGTVTVSVTGGTPSYAYLWNTSPSQSTATTGVLGPGTYTVTVTDDNGCIETASETLNNIPIMSLSTSPAGPYCIGDVVTITATAGDSYLWSPGGEMTQSITVTSDGPYCVQITNPNNCGVGFTVGGCQNLGFKNCNQATDLCVDFVGTKIATVALCVDLPLICTTCVRKRYAITVSNNGTQQPGTCPLLFKVPAQAR
ncbi:MAG TPA: hypothetical protein EYN38_10800, partial [Flavobacteriales bacterium]|nr:hypothetical protein [Flavobacteriales bacterium]